MRTMAGARPLPAVRSTQLEASMWQPFMFLPRTFNIDFWPKHHIQQFPALSLSLSVTNCRGRQATRPPYVGIFNQ